MNTRFKESSKSRALAAATALIAMLACAMFWFTQPAQAQAAEDASADKVLTAQVAPALATQDATYTYTLGMTKSGTIPELGDHLYFAFSVSANTDVNFSVANTSTNGTGIYAAILDSSGSSVWSEYLDDGEKAQGSKIYLAKGTYKVEIYGYTSYYYWMSYVNKYSFSVTKVPEKLRLSKMNAQMKIGSEKEVALTYSGSQQYAEKNLKIAKNSNPKVASASLKIESDGVATLTVTPKKMGKTVISVRLAGGNTVKYTAFVTNTIAYVAKGEKTTLTKPIGVSKVKFVNKTKKSKKIAVTTKKGKVTAKKQGRAAIVAKKDQVTYNYNVVVTDYKKLARETYRWIEEYVPNPDELKINYSYKGYYKLSSGVKVPVVYIDYSFGNETGGKSRNKIVAWYDDALDIQTASVLTANNVIKKKAIKI